MKPSIPSKHHSFSIFQSNENFVSVSDKEPNVGSFLCVSANLDKLPSLHPSLAG